VVDNGTARQRSRRGPVACAAATQGGPAACAGGCPARCGSWRVQLGGGGRGVHRKHALAGARRGGKGRRGTRRRDARPCSASVYGFVRTRTPRTCAYGSACSSPCRSACSWPRRTGGCRWRLVMHNARRRSAAGPRGRAAHLCCSGSRRRGGGGGRQLAKVHHAATAGAAPAVVRFAAAASSLRPTRMGGARRQRQRRRRLRRHRCCSDGRRSVAARIHRADLCRHTDSVRIARCRVNARGGAGAAPPAAPATAARAAAAGGCGGNSGGGGGRSRVRRCSCCSSSSGLIAAWSTASSSTSTSNQPLRPAAGGVQCARGGGGDGFVHVVALCGHHNRHRDAWPDPSRSPAAAHRAGCVTACCPATDARAALATGACPARGASCRTRLLRAGLLLCAGLLRRGAWTAVRCTAGARSTGSAATAFTTHTDSSSSCRHRCRAAHQRPGRASAAAAPRVRRLSRCRGASSRERRARCGRRGGGRAARAGACGGDRGWCGGYRRLLQAIGEAHERE
jgi:hypothetical protein